MHELLFIKYQMMLRIAFFLVLLAQVAVGFSLMRLRINSKVPSKLYQASSPSATPSNAHFNIYRMNEVNASSSKPTVLYLPGIDGKGEYSFACLNTLFEDYECYRLEVQPEDRSSFISLARGVGQALKSFDSPPIIIGESFGGVLALYLAARYTSSISRIVVVNPATSLPRTPWHLLVPLLSKTGPMYNALGVSTLLATATSGEQIRGLLGGVWRRVRGKAVERNNEGTKVGMPMVIEALKDELKPLMELPDSLPADTLLFRLGWLEEGTYLLPPLLPTLSPSLPITVLIGEGDRLLPSRGEGERLARLVRGDGSGAVVAVKTYEKGGHALLTPTFPLLEILQEQKDNVVSVKSNDTVIQAEQSADEVSKSNISNHQDGVMTDDTQAHQGESKTELKDGDVGAGHVAAEDSSPSVSEGHHSDIKTTHRDFPQDSTVEIKKGAKTRGLFSGDDLTLPPLTSEELRIAEQRTHPFFWATSPVFYSTDVDGRVGLGLGGIPNDPTRPLLFVGNHQLMGLDLPLLWGGLMKGWGGKAARRVRPLGHPLLFKERGDGGVGGGAELRKWGAVPVSPMNFYQLLKQKEAILLFPGGAREALHKTGEGYKLFWPDRVDFLRMAAMMDAIIVPFAAIGGEESARILLDAEEVSKKMPQWLTPSFPPSPSPFLADPSISNPLLPPLLAPLPPSRFYFYFLPPLDTRELRSEDESAGEGIAGDKRRSSKKQQQEALRSKYISLTQQVEGGIQSLLRIRANDPYRKFSTRFVKGDWRGWGKIRGSKVIPAPAAGLLQKAFAEEMRRRQKDDVIVNKSSVVASQA